MAPVLREKAQGVRMGQELLPEELERISSRGTVHMTWAGTFSCKPLRTFQPTKIEEIQMMVNEARKRGRTIMTVGSGHSPSDITMTKEWLCNLDKFNEVLKQNPVYGPKKGNDSEEEVKFVDLTVEAGCRVFELNQYLKQHKLAIQNLGSISDQSMAGVISTGTHGSTQFHGLVSQQIVSIGILNSEGRLIRCSSIENPELFRAAMLSLGKIGIIVYVTLRTIPEYTIKSKLEIIKFETLLKSWDTVWLDSEFIRIWWFPYSRKCVLWRGSKSSDPLSAPRASWYGTLFGRFFYESLLWISVHLFPRLTPYVERFVFKNQYGSQETLGKGDIAVQYSVEGLNMDCLFSQFVDEWAAPLVNGPDILRKLDYAITNAKEKGAYFVHAPIEVRCSNVTYSDQPFVDDVSQEQTLYPSQKWLAQRDNLSSGPIKGNNLRPYLDLNPRRPYVGEDCDKITNDQLTLFINATLYRPFFTNVPTHEWFLEFEQIMEQADGRPHWAKNFIGVEGNHIDDRDLQNQLKFGGKEFYAMKGFNISQWLGDDIVKFNRVRKEMDPSGVFLSGKDWFVRNGLLIT